MNEIQNRRKTSLSISETAENDLVRWLGILKRHKTIMAVIVAVALALGVLTFYTVTPLYTAKISILLDPNRDAAPDLNQAINNMPIDVGFVESAVAVIGSFNTIRRVVEKLNLGSDPDFAADSPPWFSFKRFFPSSHFPSPPENESETLVTPAVRAAIEKVQSSTLVRRNGLTYVVDVAVTLDNPKKAADIANAIGDAYLLDGLEARYAAAKRAASWLNERLSGLKAQLEESERNVEQYRIDHQLLSTQSGRLEKQQLAEINTQLVLARAHTAETKARLEQSQRVASEGGNILRNEYDTAVKREESLEAAISNLSAIANKSDEASIKLHELQREAASNRNLYEIFLSKFKETREETTLEKNEAHVITPAVRPVRASYPKLGSVLSIAFVLGLFASVGAAFALDFFARGFQTSEQIEQVLRCPTLAFLPIVSARELRGGRDQQSVVRYTIEEPFSRFAEGIRSIRTGVTLSTLDRAPKIIMVCSTMPTEGKSTIAASIAASASSSDLKVLLIDMDLRARATSRRFNLDSQPGLVDLLSRDNPAQENFYPIEKLSITLVPAGKHTTNPGGIIACQKMARLIEVLKNQYDLIILDCPPLFASKDSLLIAKFADSIVYVVQWNSTPRAAVQTALKAFDVNLSKLAGVALNKVDTKKLKTYTYYGHYYGYRYRHYYGRDSTSEQVEAQL